MTRWIAALLLLLALTAASGADASQTSTRPVGEDLDLPELSIAIHDDGWDAPTSIEAGRYLVTATYEGEFDYGTVAFLRLPEGWTIDDLNGHLEESAASTDDVPSDGTAVFDGQAMPDLHWIDGLTMAGGVSPLAGATAQVIVDLYPGSWAIWADEFEPAAIPLEVTGQMPADLPEPESTIDIVQSNAGDAFDFTITGDLTAGRHIVRVINATDQPHFVEFVELSRQISDEELHAFLSDDTEPASDGSTGDLKMWLTPWYAATQSPGTTQYLVLTLEPGSYAIACWIPDPRHNNRPHALDGMARVFSVTE
jgi:hypothetical protein